MPPAESFSQYPRPRPWLRAPDDPLKNVASRDGKSKRGNAKPLDATSAAFGLNFEDIHHRNNIRFMMFIITKVQDGLSGCRM